MEKWDKENTALIMAGKGFRYEGFTSEGFSVFPSYKRSGLLLRVLREIVFRTPFLPDTIFYDKSVLKRDWSYIVVYDALITKEYLEWLKREFPETKILFKYENLIGNARHILPEAIPEGISIWTYDTSDSEKYHINLFDSYYYFNSFLKEKQEPVYDVFFIGRDKGRGEFLLKLEDELKQQGLKTKFIITKDGRFSRKKKYYGKELKYTEVTDYLSKSKAVLNVVMEGQKGITLRDAESVFWKIKLITTNEQIKNADFYNKNNVFVLKDDNHDQIFEFLSSERQDPGEELIKQHSPETFFDYVTREI